MAEQALSGLNVQKKARSVWNLKLKFHQMDKLISLLTKNESSVILTLPPIQQSCSRQHLQKS